MDTEFEGLMAINLNMAEIVKQLKRIADNLEGMDPECTAKAIQEISKKWEAGAYFI